MKCLQASVLNFALFEQTLREVSLFKITKVSPVNEDSREGKLARSCLLAPKLSLGKGLHCPAI